MSTAIATTMSIQELLALPEDGLDRELIRGQLKERPMTYRNRFHSQVVARIAALLTHWNDQSSGTHDQVHAGDVGCILRRDPDTIVGIDVAYFSTAVMQRQSADTTVIAGAPVLAVEVLSPSDRMEDVRDKVREYLAAGVRGGLDRGSLLSHGDGPPTRGSSQDVQRPRDAARWCQPARSGNRRGRYFRLAMRVLRRAAGNNLPEGRPFQADRDGLGRPSYIKLGKLFPAARLTATTRAPEYGRFPAPRSRTVSIRPRSSSAARHTPEHLRRGTAGCKPPRPPR